MRKKGPLNCALGECGILCACLGECVCAEKGAKKGKAMDTVTLDATGTYRIGIAIASDTSTLTDTQARAEVRHCRL